jgi:hypothetical protein
MLLILVSERLPLCIPHLVVSLSALFFFLEPINSAK